MAAVIGSAMGWYRSATAYIWREARFGPFSSHGELRPEGLAAYFAEIQPSVFPKLEVVGGPRYDFGAMLRGAEGTHRFTLRNTGDADLELEVTGSTCKCTVGSLKQELLPPGETTEVTLNWTVKTASNDFGQAANLRTSDPAQGELELQVYGLVLDPVDPVPASFNLGDVVAGGTIELASTIYNRTAHDLEVISAEWTRPQVEALAETTVTARDVDPEAGELAVDARQAFEVTSKIPPGLSQGRLRETLRVVFRYPEGADKEKEFIDLSLVGRLVGPLSLLGGPRLSGQQGGSFVFDMGTVPLGEGRTDKLFVVLRGEERQETKLQIGQVAPGEALTATLGEPVEQGAFDRYPLELTIKKEAPEGERLGKNKDDYGIVTIEAEKDTIAPLRLRVQYSVGDPLE